MQGSLTGKLATVRPDGRPHVTPVWFILDGNELVFTTMFDTVKAENIRREPRVTMSVDVQEFPYHYVLVEGSASLHELTVDELRPWTTRIASRYVPEGRGQEYGERNAFEGELLVRVQIEKMHGHKDMAI
jgi:hypothetical protein